MPSLLPFDGWNMTSRTALSASTAAGIIADITSKLNGVGGWTVTADADTFGIFLTPPGTGLADDLRICIAGKAASIGTPTMLLVNNVTALDTATTAILLGGLAGGAAGSYGTFNWDAASPFGTGWFSGYIRGLPVASNSYITIYYTQTAVCIAIDNNANGTVKYLMLGAWIDPLSNNAGDCEANGYLYSMSCSGGVATTGLTHLASGTAGTANSATGNEMFVHGTADGNAHSVYRDPATGYWQTFTRMIGSYIFAALASAKSKGGRIIPLPITFYTPSAPVLSNIIGQSKQFYVYDWTAQRHATARSVKTSATPTYATGGYVFSSAFSSDQQAVFFQLLETWI